MFIHTMSTLMAQADRTPGLSSRLVMTLCHATRISVMNWDCLGSPVVVHAEGQILVSLSLTSLKKKLEYSKCIK